MRRLSAAMLVWAIVAAVSVAWAADPPNPTGTWTWSFSQRAGMNQTLKLKLDGDKLTGVIIARAGLEMKIEDGTYKDGELSFIVTSEGRDKEKMQWKYSGKVSGDTIKGKIEGTTSGGPTMSRDWQAKRVEEKKADDKKT
jgi:hypothetical protein